MSSFEGEKGTKPRSISTRELLARLPRFFASASNTEKGPSDVPDYHGMSDVRKALHLDEDKDFTGKRIVLGGNLRGRWHFEEELKDRGADVTVRDVETVANPFTRPKPNDFPKRAYDQFVMYMGFAFYSKQKLQKILAAALEAVDFENGGE